MDRQDVPSCLARWFIAIAVPVTLLLVPCSFPLLLLFPVSNALLESPPLLPTTSRLYIMF